MDLLLRNVRIVDGRGGDPVPHGSVAVQGNRLSYVGSMAGAPSPAAGTTVLDGGGRTVIPGLIDCHTHITIDEMDVVSPRRVYLEGELLGILQAAARGQKCLENGITTLRDCNAPGVGTFALRKAFDRGILPGPRLFLSGQAITATGGHMHVMSFEADGPDAVRRGVREQLKAGADFIKMVAEAASGSGGFDRANLQLSGDEMKPGVEVAHKLGKRVTCHAISPGGIAEALAAGVDCIEHGYAATDGQLATMKERGTWLVPTLSVHGAYLERGDEVGLTPERRANSERILASGLRTVGRAHELGVNVACGADSGSPLNPIWDLSLELTLLVRAGLTPSEALSAATMRAADLLDASADLGTLEAGKLADLVVLDGDPLTDVAAVTNVVAVVKDGSIAVNRLG